MKDIIIVENSPNSYILNKENAIPIKTFIDNKKDRELKSVYQILYLLSLVDDVRKYIRKIILNANSMNYDYIIMRLKKEINKENLQENMDKLSFNEKHSKMNQDCSLNELGKSLKQKHNCYLKDQDLLVSKMILKDFQRVILETPKNSSSKYEEIEFERAKPNRKNSCLIFTNRMENVTNDSVQNHNKGDNNRERREMKEEMIKKTGSDYSGNKEKMNFYPFQASSTYCNFLNLKSKNNKILNFQKQNCGYERSSSSIKHKEYDVLKDSRLHSKNLNNMNSNKNYLEIQNKMSNHSPMVKTQSTKIIRPYTGIYINKNGLIITPTNKGEGSSDFLKTNYKKFAPISNKLFPNKIIPTNLKINSKEEQKPYVCNHEIFCTKYYNSSLNLQKDKEKGHV